MVVLKINYLKSYQPELLSSDTESRQYQLTLFLETVFDWLEAQVPQLFFYGDVNLRHALECHFYFAGMSDNNALLPLLTATKAWKATLTTEDATAVFYDECLATLGNTSLATKTRAVIQKLALFFHLLKKQSSKSELTHHLTASDKILPVVFFAINARYAYFFKRIIDALGSQHSVFLPLGRADVINASNEMNTKVLDEGYVRFEAEKVAMSIVHPLFYWLLVAIKQYLIALGTLKTQSVSSVVFAEGTSMQDELVCLAAKSLNIPTIRVQSGRAGLLHTAYRNLSFNKMLVWGQGFIDRLKPYSKVQTYVITGNPDIQPLKETTLYVNLFSTALKGPLLTVFTQPINPHITLQDYDELVGLIHQILELDLNIRVLVRKHPVDSNQAFEVLSKTYPNQLKVSSSRQYSLNEVFAISDLAIGFYSTALSEAAAYGVVALLLQLKPEHSVFPFPEKFGAAISVHNKEQAIESVVEILTNKAYKETMIKNMNDFANYYFGPRDGEAIKNIVANIQSQQELVA